MTKLACECSNANGTPTISIDGHLESYPQLTPAALQAVFAFAAASMSQESLYAMPVELA